MPFMYPAHQGLIAPLWRRWPNLFDVPALCVGAAMPDVIDGIAGALRGHLGQTLGHSVVGLALFCVPLGIIIWAGFHVLMRRLPPGNGEGILPRAWNMTRDVFVTASPAFLPRWRIVTAGVAIGAASHIFFDLISHKEFQLLWPYHLNADIWPVWWTVEWWRAPVPFYEGGYSVGPHFAVWVVLNVVGAALLALPLMTKRGA